jgi:hypothetical protein
VLQLARTRRPRRPGEWTETKAVTFIVTLAASRSVTLAAERAGMSRKSAYSLKRRDASFAAAWATAVAAIRKPVFGSIEGDKVDKAYRSPFPNLQGNSAAVPANRADDMILRDRFFAGLANRTSNSRTERLARARPLP